MTNLRDRWRALQANLFFVKPQHGKVKFETTEFKDHSSLRNGMLLTILCALLLDSLYLFPNRDSQPSSAADFVG